ncbi:MAG: hypothetical protein C0506_16585, partial [Anaerolinea sp.]|nr:hypothetical protein [Anaerolinea sp.]
TAGGIRYAGGNLRDGYFVTVSTGQGQTETRVWKAPPGRLSFAPEADAPPWVGNDQVNFAAVNARGDRVVTLSGRTAFFDLGQKGVRPLKHTGVVNHACFSPTGPLLVTAAGDAGQQNGEVKFWDAGTGEEEKMSPERVGCDWAFKFVTVSADGTWVVATGGPDAGETAASDSVRAVLWPVDAQGHPGPAVELRGGHTEPITFAAFGPSGPSGRYVVTTGTDDRACVWFLNTNKTAAFVRALTKHTADVVQAAFAPDGKYLVTVGEDGKAIVWETVTGNEVMILEHGGRVTTAAFSPNGKYLVTAGQDGKARLWQFQVEAGGDRLNPSPLIAAFDHHGSVLSATFSADGTRLRTLSRPANTAGPERAGITSAVEKPGVWAMEWELLLDERPLDVIRAEGEIVARRKLDETRHLRSIPVDQLAELWDERRAAYLAWAESRGEPVADLPPAVRAARRAEGDVRRSLREARRAEATDLWATADWHLTRAIKRVEGDTVLRDALSSELRIELYSSRARITLRRAAGERVDWDAVL